MLINIGAVGLMLLGSTLGYNNQLIINRSKLSLSQLEAVSNNSISKIQSAHMELIPLQQIFVICLQSNILQRRTAGSGGGAIPPAQSDNMQSYEIGPPPDLPSLLLANRIIYIGMPLVPSVTELIIAQLLYLNYQNEQIITMYINSPGTNSPDGRAFSFDTEAFAIADTMQFIRPPIRTIAVGQAFGTAAMLLSLGQKGNRFALPNASIMLNQPRSRARGQASDVAIKAREIINNRKVTNEFLAKVRS